MKNPKVLGMKVVQRTSIGHTCHASGEFIPPHNEMIKITINDPSAKKKMINRYMSMHMFGQCSFLDIPEGTWKSSMMRPTEGLLLMQLNDKKGLIFKNKNVGMPEKPSAIRKLIHKPKLEVVISANEMIATIIIKYGKKPYRVAKFFTSPSDVNASSEELIEKYSEKLKELNYEGI